MSPQVSPRHAAALSFAALTRRSCCTAPFLQARLHPNRECSLRWYRQGCLGAVRQQCVARVTVGKRASATPRSPWCVCAVCCPPGRDMGYPFSFQLGSGKVIRAWELVVPTMRVGEQWYVAGSGSRVRPTTHAVLVLPVTASHRQHRDVHGRVRLRRCRCVTRRAGMERLLSSVPN